MSDLSMFRDTPLLIRENDYRPSSSCTVGSGYAATESRLHFGELGQVSSVTRTSQIFVNLDEEEHLQIRTNASEGALMQHRERLAIEKITQRVFGLSQAFEERTNSRVTFAPVEPKRGHSRSESGVGPDIDFLHDELSLRGEGGFFNGEALTEGVINFNTLRITEEEEREI